MTRPPDAARPVASGGPIRGRTSAPLLEHVATGGASRPPVGPTAVRRRDPAAMTPGERLAELAEILAAGFRRFRQRALDDVAESEAPCDQAVDGDRAESAEEVA